MFKCIYVLLIICLPKWQSVERFIDNYNAQYLQDSSIRCTDTLFFLPTVMNLCRSNSKYKQLTIPQKRQSLFLILSMESLYLSYSTAFDLNKSALFHDTRGDLDFWEEREYRKMNLVQDDFSLIHIDQRIKFKKIMDWIGENHPDYVFAISDIDGIGFELYWAIKDNSLFALIYDLKSCGITKYDAKTYIENIAPDYVFSSDLRLDLLLGISKIS